MISFFWAGSHADAPEVFATTGQQNKQLNKFSTSKETPLSWQHTLYRNKSTIKGYDTQPTLLYSGIRTDYIEFPFLAPNSTNLKANDFMLRYFFRYVVIFSSIKSLKVSSNYMVHMI